MASYDVHSPSPAPVPPPAAGTFDYTLEAVRGLAALLVVLGHVLAAGPQLDMHYRPAGIWRYAPPGHLSVLVFFLLSGYVIGRANAAPITTGSIGRRYLKKRLVRLYPLYVLALALTAALAASYHKPISLTVMGGYLGFMQGFVMAVPSYNQPIWSLPYEVIYYLLFLPVSARRWPAGWVAGVCVGLGLLITQLGVLPPIAGALAYGGAFWFSGLWLAGRPPREQPLCYGTLLAYLLLLLSYQRLNILYTALHTLGLDVNETKVAFFDRPIVFSDLSCLLIGLPLLAAFTNRRVPGPRWLTLATLAVPGLYLAGYVATGRIWQPANFNSMCLPALFYLLAVGVYAARQQVAGCGAWVVGKLTVLGGVSYGVYIIHYPLLFVFHEVAFFRGTAVTFLVRLLLYFAVVFALAWALEYRLQPWLKRQLIQS
jgi:peptidoglycan/LPS O-acetylase OafA/YrhL